MFDWCDATDGIRIELDRRTGTPNRPRVVGITGPVGAGKSALAARLGGCVVTTDDYLPDYDRTPEHERDLPDSSDLGSLAAHLALLRSNLPATLPVWSFQTHRRESWRTVAPAPLVVVEGIFALHPRVRSQLDLCVFIESDVGVRWARWEHLETTGQRGWGVAYARSFFHAVAEPTFARHAEHYRAAAHVVIRNHTGVPGGISPVTP